MRDPERIDVMIEELRELWKQNPDQRLTQLVFNAACYSNDPVQSLKAHQFFNVEDDATLRGIKFMYDAHKEFDTR